MLHAEEIIKATGQDGAGPITTLGEIDQGRKENKIKNVKKCDDDDDDDNDNLSAAKVWARHQKQSCKK